MFKTITIIFFLSFASLISAEAPQGKGRSLLVDEVAAQADGLGVWALPFRDQVAPLVWKKSS